MPYAIYLRPKRPMMSVWERFGDTYRTKEAVYKALVPLMTIEPEEGRPGGCYVRIEQYGTNRGTHDVPLAEIMLRSPEAKRLALPTCWQHILEGTSY
jgi:hypothetical protein